jgi:hypothetical protein
MGDTSIERESVRACLLPPRKLDDAERGRQNIFLKFDFALLLFAYDASLLPLKRSKPANIPHTSVPLVNHIFFCL